MQTSKPIFSPCKPASRTILLRQLRQALQEQAIRRARQDPAAFLALALGGDAGVPVVLPPLHRDLQRFLGTQRRALIELPRDHGKTTQVCTHIAWELGRNPSLRVILICSTDTLATERGRYIRTLIEHNAIVRRVFPMLQPASPWKESEFAVQRQCHVIGASVQALGLGCGATGARADLLVCDDVVAVNAVFSVADRQRAKRYFFDNLMNLLEPQGRCWCLSTPWHVDDLNQELKRTPGFALFRRDIGNDLEPIWPEKWPRERLVERRAEIGSRAFARGYHLQPIAEEACLMRPEWIRTWLPDDQTPDRVIMSIDPAAVASERNDASALVVLARIGNVVHCLAAEARRVTAPDLVAWIDTMDRQWQPDVILFEACAAFAAVKDLLAARTRFGPRLQGVKPTSSKAARISALAVCVENGSFRLREAPGGGIDPAQQALFQEMLLYPLGAHDDLVDAAALGVLALLRQGNEPRIWI